MNKIIVAGKEYLASDLTGAAKEELQRVQAIDQRIQEATNLMAILTKAKRAYIAELKTEILSDKSGLDMFGD